MGERMKISDIEISSRHRKDMGDLQALADSIELQGLLQPIGISEDGILVFGERRLLACRDVLGRTEIDCRIVNVTSIVEGERDENEIRKDFTASERVAIADTIKDAIGNRQGHRGNIPEVPVGKRPRDIAAEKAGFGNETTYRQAKAVVDTAAQEVVEAMDSGTIAISAAAALAKKPVEHQRAVVAKVRAGEAKTPVDAERKIKEEKREERRVENRQKVENTTGLDGLLSKGAKFATIAIDPPWDWGDEGDADQLGRARPTYATMTIDQLLAYPIPDLSDVDCHLYLWITNRSLPKGFRLIEAWGFRYITCLTWCKPSIGMGNYFRGSSEQILFAVKGSQPLARKNVGTWFAWPRGPRGHSSKPEEFFTEAATWSPGPRLEVFGRSQREGWTVIGAEI